MNDIETTESATVDPAADVVIGSGLAIRPGQTRFNEMQLAALRQLGIEDAPDGVIDLFFHRCQKTGLDPFAKEIYLIGRNSQVTRYVPNSSGEGQHKETKWETVYSTQVGIQGFRKKLWELADAKGDTIEVEGPLFAGEDGEWRDMWPNAAGVPEAAKYIIWKNGKSIPFVAYYTEFVQESGTGADRGPNSMWSKMTRNQLGKCAEANAIQKAYPGDLSGLVLDIAAQNIGPIIDETGAAVQQQPRQQPRLEVGGRGVEGLRARAQAAAKEPVPAETVLEADSAETVAFSEGAFGQMGDDGNWTPEARRKGLNRMHQLFTKGDLLKDNRADRLIVTSALIGRHVGSSNDLRGDEIAHINHQLGAWDEAGELGQQITEVLNIDSLKKAEE